MLATAVTTNDEILRGEWREIAPGWLLPVKMTMIAVFGKDWGPEELTLSEIVVE